MKATFLAISGLGALSCLVSFREEAMGGKLYPSLFFASLGWAAGFVVALIFWE